MSNAIFEANGISVIIECLEKTQQCTVLSLACRALSALALQPENRTRIAEAKGLRVLVNLLRRAWSPSQVMDQRPFISESVQEAALAACTNLLHSSEANRQLIAELDAIHSMVKCALFARDGLCVLNAARAIANVAFESHFASAKCIMVHADSAICSAISSVNLVQENAFLEAAFRALANMALDEVAQSGLAASDAMIWCVRALSKCQHVRVLRAVAHATAAIAYKSLANKVQFAQLGAISACLSVVSRFGFGSLRHTLSHAPAVYASSLAACILLSFHPNHLIFEDCQGVDIYTNLCRSTEQIQLLRAGAMVLATIAPSCHDRSEARAEGRVLHFEHVGGLHSLVRCAKWAFSREQVPGWLQAAILSLRTDTSHASMRQSRSKHICLELIPRHEFFEEFLVHVELDHIVSESLDLQNLAFRLY